MVEHARGALARDAQLVELGVEVVDEVQGHRLRRHRFDRRAELLLALVGQHQVLEQQPQVVGELGDRRAALAKEVAAEHDVADQAPLERVVVGRHRAQLAQLAEIVEEDAEQHQVAVELAVVAADGGRQLRHRHHVLEQAAAVGVMHRLGGRMLAQLRTVGGERVGGQPPHRRAFDVGVEQRAESHPQIVDVLARGRNQQRLVEAEATIVLGDLAAIVDRQLQLLAVALDRAAESDEAVQVELAMQRRAVGPHLGDDRAAGVGELHVEIALAIAVLAQLLLGEQRVALHRIPGFPGADRRVALVSRHGVSP